MAVPDRQVPSEGSIDALTRAAQRILADALAVVHSRQPDVEVTGEIVEAPPAPALRERAGGAVEIVVGSRGLGGFSGALLGSVSVHVAGHVHRPVVVVRPGRERVFGEVVAGIDDSEECEPALAYAFEQAALRGAGLRAIYAWQLPVHAYAPEAGYDLDEIRAAHHKVAADRIAAYRDRYPQVDVVEDVRCAHPVDALTQASERADLVVVGSHGRGGLGSVLLGSVSRGVLHHAHGAVAVVRA
ncbi:universal stress protein [Thermocatellispora tengchongensis]|uniref:universal stress protein n=1 Tax=Thermocatellispora tengchongensis TaxID=1073253 RepID=UPI003631A0DC